MKRFIFKLKQILPFMYWSKYTTPDGKKHITIWRQCFCKPFNIKQFTLAD